MDQCNAYGSKENELYQSLTTSFFSNIPDLIKVEIIKNMIDTKYDTKYNGGEKMSSWDKLLKRFLELDYDIRFEEIVKVMKEYGYEIKQSVTHL